MELHQLRYLRAVVRTGSVSRAAEEEHVAQPSVSKQIQLLERELGVPLLHRVGRGVAPTDAALALADCAERVFDDLATTAAMVREAGEEVAATIRLCATETVTDHLLPGLITGLTERYPRVRVSAEMTGSADGVGRVLRDAADLAVVVLPLADSRLDIHPLFEEEVLLAVPRGHRWDSGGAVGMEDVLRSGELLCSMPGLGLRAQVDEAAARLGMTLEPRVEMRSQQALLAMAAAGGGVALAPRLSVAGNERVAIVGIEPAMRRQIGWVRRRGRHLPGPAMELIAGLVAKG